ncbi:MAG: YIP1 family protein [Sulfurovum sp.]|nr:YIP1 family protein [Sulfurovum sp.]
MIDINKTIELIKDGLFDPRQTWQNYLEEDHDWKETAILLTIPLVLISAILTGIFSWIFSSYTMFGMQGGIGATIKQLILSFVGIGIASFIFSYLARIFEGKHDFNKGFAVLSLAAIPGLIGSVLGTLPMVGILLSLGFAILGLVYLYKIIPSYLEVPQGKRIIHYILSLLATFVAMIIIGSILGLGSTSSSDYSSSTGSSSANGMFGEFSRQAELVEKAEQDSFSPPSGGRVTEKQVQTLLSTLQKVDEYRKTKEASLQKLGEQVKDKEDIGIGDLMKMASGAGSVMSVANAEMDIVKSAGRNWAEHTWVKEQLRIAVMQKDISDVVKDNYALYQKYADRLIQYGYAP